MVIVINIPLPNGATLRLNIQEWIALLVFILIFRAYGWPMVSVSRERSLRAIFEMFTNLNHRCVALLKKDVIIGGGYMEPDWWIIRL
ncbi:hypothetical protein LZL87_007352 [Fusarium oxysporum]|nr:hypothetical protein LZL87_007352 [Fusarium oxysporum]